LLGIKDISSGMPPGGEEYHCNEVITKLTFSCQKRGNLAFIGIFNIKRNIKPVF
jgi:hypothetical protein